MELIDDWGTKDRIAPTYRDKDPKPSGPASPQAISDKLAGFEPRPLNLHCYEDVGYPWVQVVFSDTVKPEQALEVGKALAEVPGIGNVYFNSLRPKAVYFVLEPAFEPMPDLPASRYGTLLKDIQEAWYPQRNRLKQPAPATR
jgi:hypothetical protein